MKNPWLEIPLSDYESHMSLPEVAQAQLLAGIFSEHLAVHSPGSVAVAGCAGGNGFDRIDPAVTRRVVGVDLNGQYLDATRARFGTQFKQLELVEGDIQSPMVAFAPVDMVYAALVLEYVDAGVALGRMREWLNPRGTLVTVVQLPAGDLPAVTTSQFGSLNVLETVMQFVAPEQLHATAERNGLRSVSSATRQTPCGKRFEIQQFQAE